MKRTLVLTAFLLVLSFPINSFGSTFTPPFVSTNSVSTVIYKNNVLSIKGMTGIGNITIYSIIGNEVATFQNVNLENFSRAIDLDSRTMFILRIETATDIKTFKLVTR